MAYKDVMEEIRDRIKREHENGYREGYNKGVNDAWKAIAKIQEHENQTEGCLQEIKVGDEVKEKCKGVILSVMPVKRTCRVYWQNGDYTVEKELDMLALRTGRHFTQIEEVLKQLREGEE